MTMKEIQQKTIDTMRQWQKVEDDSVASTAQIMKKTDNPIIRMVMEIIQRDSMMHYRVQRWIADSLEQKAVFLSPDELAEVWDEVESHQALERKMVEGAEEMIASLKSYAMPLQKYFLNYLLNDEKKHNDLLSSLENIKKGFLP